MQERSLLLLGACTISGLGLPATLSLPVLISRAFRDRSEMRLTIEAENHVENLSQLSTWLNSGQFAGPYDLIVLQSLIGRETTPQLGIAARMNRPGVTGLIYRRVRDCFATPAGHRWINRLRILLGYTPSCLDQYEVKLLRCLQQLRQSSPSAKIFLLGQAPPLAKTRSAFQEINQQNRQKLQELALRYDFDFIDLFPLFMPHAAEAIFQTDGLHFTAQGQRIVAQAIVERIRASGVIGSWRKTDVD